MKNSCIIILVLIGFLLIPTTTFACGNSSKKSCSTSEMAAGNCKMKCCQKKSKDKSSKGCDGKCGKSTCQTQTISFGAILPLSSEIKNNQYLVLNLKQAFYNKKTNISEGFYFIWSPPNIG